MGCSWRTSSPKTTPLILRSASTPTGQSSYALEKRGNDFAEVFDLCEGVENDLRPACYQGLDWDASVQSIKQGADATGINESTSALCILGGGSEARSNCVFGAVDYFIRHHYDDAPAGEFCGSFDADLRPPVSGRPKSITRTWGPRWSGERHDAPGPVAFAGMVPQRIKARMAVH